MSATLKNGQAVFSDQSVILLPHGLRDGGVSPSMPTATAVGFGFGGLLALFGVGWLVTRRR